MPIRSGLLVLGLLFASGVNATPAKVDFEQFEDGETLTSQIAGLTFVGGLVLRGGISLNEFEFPPRSGNGVLVDQGSDLRIEFESPVFSIGAYFTYMVPLSLRAFDADGNVIGSRSSSFLSNLALSGDPGSAANEYLEISLASPISSVAIHGDDAGYSFAMDDLSYNVEQMPAVPEPTVNAMLCIGSGALLWTLSIRRRSPS